MRFNRVFLGGRLVRDPAVDRTADGEPTCQFTLAVDAVNRGEPAAFITCVAERADAERIGRLHKGAAVFIEGRLRQDTWTPTDGVRRHATRVLVERVVLLDNPPDSAGP